MVLTIGELADAARVATNTVRHYERRGLLMPEDRTTVGYWQYGPRSVRRLSLIRRARAMGFSLDEIDELLLFGETPESTAGHILAATERRIALHRSKIEELERLRGMLRTFADECRGEGPTATCQILRHFFAHGEGTGLDAPTPIRPRPDHTTEETPWTTTWTPARRPAPNA